MKSAGNPRALLLVCIGLCLALGVAASKTRLLFSNTLHDNGSWISTKATLEKSVFGAKAFLNRLPSLARGRVDLSVYHGFQEIVYRQPVELRELRFRFRLDPEAYLYVSFGRGGSRYTGVRFSSNKHHPGGVFDVTAAGRFTHREPFTTSFQTPNQWHEAHLTCEHDGVLILVDGETVGRFEVPGRTGRVGFRGGQKRALVDEVAIKTEAGEVMREDFSSHASEWPVAPIAMAVSLALSGAFAALRLRRSEPRVVGFSVVLLNVVLLAIAGLVYGYQYWTGDHHSFTIGTQRMSESDWIQLQAVNITAHTRETYENPPDGNAKRILFLGSSQTWGAGASAEAATFVARIERLLDQFGRYGQVECVNGGISGLKSPQVLELYQSEFLALAPDLVVVNLSNNDRDLELFRASLEKIAGVSREAGVPLIFVLEPNSVEYASDLPAKHQIMRSVGQAAGVPVVDMHAYLGEQVEEGILWWDFVHLTDFGHQLFAERLAKMLGAALDGTPRTAD